MRWSSFAIVGGLAASASAKFDMSGAVVDTVIPNGQTPQGCQTSQDGQFQVHVEPMGGQTKSRRSLQKRACGGGSTLVMALKDGVLTDAKKRTGYIASNYQFQFDGPPQAGALYTGGFSVCGNGSLALGGSSVFYRCLSGNFYNLYDRSWAAQCSPVTIEAMPCDASENQPSTPTGNVVGTSMMATTMVTVLSDGQPQVVPTSVPIPMCQIGDGQVQAHTTPCAEASQSSQAPEKAPVSQIGDGQPQAPMPSEAPVSEGGDGQIVAPPESAPAAPQSPSAPAPSSSQEAATGAPSQSGVAAPTGQPQAPPSNPTATQQPVTAGSDKMMPGLSVGLAMAVAAVALCL
ncbi:hypothetical protein HIM_08871 [Hirsutella minnesotensis 3608]|uniref:Cell wall mannoprotein PIR1-like C-terminal domain-containing protein n=1 Tax=Hirsutella minnesotensis 3608 TaxID=1043627 RepID=A0A0F8A3F3_9HYPO|nr:hypothetical protein HIM_08871 [Hirsutella minnesotensis 3608]